jgi:uridine kinase
VTAKNLPDDPVIFAATLQEKMSLIYPGVSEFEPYEFRYALDNLTPPAGWLSVRPLSTSSIEALIQPIEFYHSIQLKPMREKRILLDAQVLELTQILFTGLVSGLYPLEWVNQWFYFDLRSFIFFVRTRYYNPVILEHFGVTPYLQFETRQSCFDHSHEIGYREFRQTNEAVDGAFIDLLSRIIRSMQMPLVLTLVGPTAAGKTEIVERIKDRLMLAGKSINSIEMDNFFKDRDFRDTRGTDLEVIHFDLFKNCLRELKKGHKVYIPRYDFINATSSHDLKSQLRSGRVPMEVEPAEILLLEGNFPFQLPEIAPLVDLKVVYLTDDPIRLKRKWKRDMDYRKKYEPVYFCNRYFKSQRLRAEEIYLPLMEVCDMVVDTTNATLWVTPELSAAIPSNS